jgi:4-amino-4-deoxy-L-arabinose transferase-like glycosyltransferase
MKRSLIAHWRRIALIILLVFVVLNNSIWQLQGGGPLQWDDSIHLSESLEASRMVAAPEVPLKNLLYVAWYYPPFVSWSAIPFYAVFGEGQFAGSFAITGFLVVLLLSTYGMGRRLFDENVGLLSALFISAFPIVMELSRQFMLDLPLASMCALSLYLLIRTDEFNSTGWSLLLGIALGCGSITKWTFTFFLVYPFLFTGAVIFLKDIKNSHRVRNLVLCFIAACAVGIPWYSLHFMSILMSRSQLLNQDHRTVVDSITYYLQILPQQTSWLLFFPLVFGIIFYGRQYRFRHLVPVLSIVGGYILLTMVNFKMPRFSIPLLPPFTVLACAGILGWVTQLGRPTGRRVQWLIALSALVLVQTTVMTYVACDSHIGKMVSTPILSTPIIPVRGAKEHDWQQASILRAVLSDSFGQSKDRKSLRVIPELMSFNWASFEYIVTLYRMPVVVSSNIGFPLRSDYVVFKTGELNGDAVKWRQITKIVASDTLSYEFVKSFPLPDSSAAVLMRARQ